MSYISYPFAIDYRGRTAEVDYDGHVRDLIEMLLFTSQGERVNRPDFGTNLMQMVFLGASDEMAATLQFLVQAALQQWLGDRITLNGINVESMDSTLTVNVSYIVTATQESRVSQFSRAY